MPIKKENKSRYQSDWKAISAAIRMPIEYSQFQHSPPAVVACPRCGQHHPDFMRGQVQSTWRRILHLPYCAVICHRCKQIIGWEKP